MPKRFFLDIKHWEINNSQSSLHKTGRKADNAGIYGHFIFSRFMLAFLVKKDLKKHHTAASSFCKLNNLSNFFESLKTLSLTLAVFILFAQFPAESHASGSGILKAIEKELVELAKKGKLDPVIGRNKEIERIAQILLRRRKNNPVLIGDPGVGKTAIIEGLAQKIISKNLPRVLHDKRVMSLDISSIVAGTKYRGQFEERLESLMLELENNNNITLLRCIVKFIN